MKIDPRIWVPVGTLSMMSHYHVESLMQFSAEYSEIYSDLIKAKSINLKLKG